MTRFYYILCCWFCCWQLSAAQQAYTLSDSAFYWRYDVNERLTYVVWELANASQRDLLMHFEVQKTADFPTAWITEVSYPRSGGYLVSDTGRFWMPVPQGAPSPYLFFALVNIHQHLDTATFFVKFWPDDDPADSAKVRLDFGTYALPLSALPTLPRPTVWPNPARHFALVAHPAPAQRWALYDGTGRAVAEGVCPLGSPTSLPLEGLAQGIYHCVLRTEDGRLCGLASLQVE